MEGLDLKPRVPSDKEMRVKTDEEKPMEVENEKDDTKKKENEDKEREKKLSFYRIKKNRIIKEFIAVLRELDA